MNLGILIVEDNIDAAKLLKEILEADNHFVITAEDKTAALSAISANPNSIDVVILDLCIPPNKKGLPDELYGFETLEVIKKEFPQIEVIVLTAYEDVNFAVRSIQLGAYDFLTKAPKLEILKDKLKKIADLLQIEKEYLELKRRDKFQYIIGNSKSIRNVLKLIDKIADSDASVLIEGETGTGKELIARAVHDGSKRLGNPFVAINCAAIPSGLLEDMLFGHERGAFNGAIERRIGLFEEANNGTLFLDEIGEMKPDLQAKLLRAIDTQSIRRVGGNREIKINTRIVAATNRNIDEQLRSGVFGEALFFRLNQFRINLPPLRRRKADIPILAKYFLDNYCKDNEIKKKELSRNAIDKLLNYNWPGNVRELKNVIHWPGNVRELKNVIQGAIILNKEKEVLNAKELEIGKRQINFAQLEFDDLFYLTLREAEEKFEKKYLKYQMNSSKTQSEAAKKAGMDRSNFHKLLQKHNLL